MSNRVIDGSSIFTGNDIGKDGLRKQVGTFYEIVSGSVVTSVGQNPDFILTPSLPGRDQTGLLPFYTQRIMVSTGSQVEDYSAWAASFRSLFVQNVEYIDHYYVMPIDHSSVQAINIYESYGYESLSKTVPPLSLLNIHDQEDFPVDVLGPAGYQMQQFLDQFSINNVEATMRQNLFFASEKIKDIKIGHIIPLDTNIPNQPNKPYNSYIKINTNPEARASEIARQEELFYETKMLNKLFSFLKRTEGAGLDFYLESEGEMQQVNVKGFVDFISNYNLVTFTPEDDEKYYKDFEEASTFESQFLRLEMLSRVRDFVNDNMRARFENILIDGDVSPTLILGYKIQKFTQTGTRPVQTVYVMTPENRNFYDSLLSYDTTYRYEIKAITLVLGNSYSYSNIEENEEDGNIMLTFVNRPSLQMLEIPVLTQDSIITDIPNPPPEVSFFNERGNKNEIAIVLDQATIVENSSPDNYPTYFSGDYVSQNKVFRQQQDTQIQFSTIYTSNIYEIYRVDEKPKGYADFENNLLTIIGEAGVEQTDNLFRDLVVPHKKYYYLIRTLTNFGIHSNPTRIYEVEVIQDSDETYLVYNEFKFETVNNTTETKLFKKFLQIKPSLPQVAFDRDQINDLSTTDIYNTSVVGTDQDLVWGRQFKIRVTSKKTGKKIDLNVTFNLVDENTQPTN